jgi:ABC-2 type transport system ATP-binding protein
VQIVEMRELVRSLKGKHTILLSSHILSEISETCDRILVLRDGAIGAAGTEAELTGKLLRGSRVDVVVRGNASAARDAVESAEGVTKIADLEHDEATKGSGVIALRVEADRDARAAIARAVIEAKLDLLAIGPSQDELENVFISLAGGTRAARAAVALSEASDDADSDVEREDA